jgi:rubrerythrin
MILKKIFKMIEDELKDHEKYKRYAEMFHEAGYPKDIVIIFDRIADMELKHAHYLKKVYEYLGGT